MWILIISIIAFIVICAFINFIDKNKEKLMEKLKIEKIQVMKCPRCFNEYDNLDLHFCKHCNTSLDREIKYKLPKKLKKKIAIIIGGIILAIVIGLCTYIAITNYIEEQQRLEKYNSDISMCYEVIKNESDFEKFKTIIREYKEDLSFESKAYINLYKAIDERIENLKKGQDDGKLVKMLYEIKTSYSINDDVKKEMENKYLIANSYSHINKVNKYIEQQEYKDAYDLLISVVLDNTDKNTELINLATKIQNEIQDKAFEQVIAKAQEQINNKEYNRAQSTLSYYKDLGNQTIVDMYNNATNEVNRINAEEKAKAEAERIAREKAEAEEKARKEAEEKARKKSQGVRIGMTKQDVLDSSWGAPKKINTTTTQYGVHEQWVYGGGNYLYFDDGILTSIQN